MAKKSMIARNVKRQKLVKRFAARRAELKKIIASPKSSDDEKHVASEKLKKMPRDASPTRLRNRCAITGRPHGFYRKFGLGRNKLREQTMDGNIPGVRKASW
jgi:small subunit ribosomal protein S14